MKKKAVCPHCHDYASLKEERWNKTRQVFVPYFHCYACKKTFSRPLIFLKVCPTCSHILDSTPIQN